MLLDQQTDAPEPEPMHCPTHVRALELIPQLQDAIVGAGAAAIEHGGDWPPCATAHDLWADANGHLEEMAHGVSPLSTPEQRAVAMRMARNALLLAAGIEERDG